jgi:hypothetical protein
MSDISFHPVDANHLFGDVIETKGQWYPIETAPAGDWIITFNTNSEMNISRYDKDEDDDAWWQCGTCGLWEEPKYGPVQITHWMPLPAPPKK